MTDANEAWRTDQAMRAFQALRSFDLIWIEEPIRPDDYAGYARLRAHGGVSIAAGENLHTLAEFAALIAEQGVDFPEPDLTTCGGITPWMKIAHPIAEAHGTAGHFSRGARSPCSPSGSGAKCRLSGSARFRARTVHRATAGNEGWSGDCAGPARSWHRV